jgi:hypothetical protein
MLPFQTQAARLYQRLLFHQPVLFRNDAAPRPVSLCCWSSGYASGNGSARTPPRTYLIYNCFRVLNKLVFATGACCWRYHRGHKADIERLVAGCVLYSFCKHVLGFTAMRRGPAAGAAVGFRVIIRRTFTRRCRLFPVKLQ